MSTTADKYPVFSAVLTEYFPTVENPEDRSELFIQKYRRVGEHDIAFTGLDDELKALVKKPTTAAIVINEALGTDFTPQEARQHIISLDRDIKGIDDERTEAADDPMKLLNYWSAKEYTVPRLGWTLPIYQWGIISGLVSFIGYLGKKFLDFPIIGTFFLLLLILGFIGVFLAAFIMFSLRDEVVNMDKTLSRDAALQEFKSRRESRTTQVPSRRIPSLRRKR